MLDSGIKSYFNKLKKKNIYINSENVAYQLNIVDGIDRMIEHEKYKNKKKFAGTKYQNKYSRVRYFILR